MLNEKIIHEENLHVMKKEIFTSKYSYNEDQLDSSEECDNGGMNYIDIQTTIAIKDAIAIDSDTSNADIEEFERLCGSKLIYYDNVSIFYSCQ